MSVLTYALETLAPVILPAPGGDPNTVNTLSHVPGGAILGALAARWIERNPGVDPAVHPEFRRLFLDGTTRFRNAGPAPSGDAPFIPAPRSLRLDKSGTSPDLFDLALEPETADRPDLDLVSVIARHISWSDERMAFARPRLETVMHHQRSRKFGRPVDGDLFHYQAIARGERFVGAVECDDPDDEGRITALLGQEIRLGRSRSSRYGRTRVTLLLRAPDVEVRRFGGDDDDEVPDVAVVTLLSDFVPAWGGPTDPFEALQAELRQLRPKLGSVQGAWVDRSRFDTFVSVFRGRTDLRAGLRAGSVLRFDGDPPALEVLTLGDRRAEGFGRVAVGWQGFRNAGRRLDDEPTVRAVARPADSAIAALVETEATVLGHIYVRWLEDRLRRAVTQARLPSRMPSASVLGGFRQVLPDLPADSEERFVDEMKRLLGSKASDALQSCRMQFQHVSAADWAPNKRWWPLPVLIWSLVAGSALVEVVLQQVDPMPDWLKQPGGKPLASVGEAERRRLGRLLADGLMDVLRRGKQENERAATGGGQ